MYRIKTLLQALLNIFLDSKKYFLAAQAMPVSHNWIELGATLNSTVMPVAGWLKVFITTTSSNAWFDISIFGGVAVNLPAVNFTNANSTIIIPVKQGDAVTFNSDGCTVALAQLFYLDGAY